MKRFESVLLVLGMLIGMSAMGNLQAANTPNDLVVRAHFVGTLQLAADTNAAKIQEILALPASLALRGQTLDRLASAPQQLFRQRIKAPVSDPRERFRPLVEDLFQRESWCEVHSQPNEPLQYALAIRLPKERAALWNDNLRSILTEWKLGALEPFSGPGEEGWVLNAPGNPSKFRFVRTASWCVLGIDHAKPAVMDELLALVKKSDKPDFKPGDTWFTLFADLPRLAALVGPLPEENLLPQPLPVVDVEVKSKAAYLRSQAKLEYRQAQSWKSDPWLIPTNLINEPLVDFGAIRDTAGWLSRWELTRGMKAPLPNQCFFWSQASGPVNTYMSAHLKDGPGFMKELAERLPKYLQTNAPFLLSGGFNWLPSTSRILITGLPLMYPNLSVTTNGNNTFLLCGLLPLALQTNPPPHELLSQIMGRDSLLYYHWEITEERLNQVRHVYPLLEIMKTSDSPDAATKRRTVIGGRKWLEAVASHLGNTITEITVASPRELQLHRTSHFGLTGMELLILAEWLDSSRFPLFGYELPAARTASR